MDASNENPLRPRFRDVTKEELDAVVRSAVPKNTRAAISFWMNVFQEFDQERRVSIQLRHVPPKSSNTRCADYTKAS